MMRASLLATATTALFQGILPSRLLAHTIRPSLGSAAPRLRRVSSERAPCTRLARRYRLPRLVIGPRRTVWPLECCDGTRPSEAAKARPLANALASGTAAGMAVEITGPTPRSEEHTSELQSQSNLVCRLLLEKKK